MQNNLESVGLLLQTGNMRHKYYRQHQLMAGLILESEKGMQVQLVDACAIAGLSMSVPRTFTSYFSHAASIAVFHHAAEIPLILGYRHPSLSPYACSRKAY